MRWDRKAEQGRKGSEGFYLERRIHRIVHHGDQAGAHNMLAGVQRK